MLNIVLFGPPGAGKGTQSQKLIEKYGLVHLSTGDILRNEISNGTALGMEAKQIMDRGDLVSDDIVIGMIESKLDSNSNAKGFIFDGFPRTQAQAVALDDLLQKKGTAISAMLALEVDNAELIKRLLLRGKDTGRADDSNETIISNRVSEYNNKTLPLKQYYSEQSKFHSINGIGTVESIFNELIERIIFINAEIELTMLENDIEHLDLTVNDFEEATEIDPELKKDMDEVRSEEPSEKEESKKNEPKKEESKNDDSTKDTEEKHKGIIETLVEKVSQFFHSDPKEKTASKKKTSPAKKTVAKKAIATKAPVKKAVSTVKKAVKKVAAKAPVKKAVKTVKTAAKKVTKKIASKAPVKKATSNAKKAVKKVIKKVAVKKVVKSAKKIVTKAAAKKSTVKKTIKKAVKKVAVKSAAKKAVKTIKKVVKKAAVKKAVKKIAAKAPVKKVVKAVKKIAPKKAAKRKK